MQTKVPEYFSQTPSKNGVIINLPEKEESKESSGNLSHDLRKKQNM